MNAIHETTAQRVADTRALRAEIRADFVALKAGMLALEYRMTVRLCVVNATTVVLAAAPAKLL